MARDLARGEIEPVKRFDPLQDIRPSDLEYMVRRARECVTPPFRLPLSDVAQLFVIRPELRNDIEVPEELWHFLTKEIEKLSDGFLTLPLDDRLLELAFLFPGRHQDIREFIQELQQAAPEAAVIHYFPVDPSEVGLSSSTLLASAVLFPDRDVATGHDETFEREVEMIGESIGEGRVTGIMARVAAYLRILWPDRRSRIPFSDEDVLRINSFTESLAAGATTAFSAAVLLAKEVSVTKNGEIRIIPRGKIQAVGGLPPRKTL